MALAFLFTGLLVYVPFESRLDRTIDHGLRSRAAGVEVFVRGELRERSYDPVKGPPERSELTLHGATYTQVLDDRGRVFDTTPPQGRRSLLTHAQRRSVLSGRALGPITDAGGRHRLLALPFRAGDRRFAGVVATPLSGRDEAVLELRDRMLIAGPPLLLLAALAGYGVASVALRPVERMRRRAAGITAAAPGERLPVPPARDELAQLGRTLNEMLARLESALERERNLVANASHQFRTPLAILKMELELALRRNRSKDELRAAARSAAEEADRLSALADKLLFLAKSDRRELAHTEVTDVAVSLERVEERYERQARAAGREIRVDAPPGLAVMADPAQLEQALQNMVENALRHGEGAVTLSARERLDRVLLHVRDEGQGFDPGFVSQAFERFSRGSVARAAVPGSGLGLSIVEAIARANGGSAGVQNDPGGGADAWIDLRRAPLARLTAPERGREAQRG